MKQAMGWLPRSGLVLLPEVDNINGEEKVEDFFP